MTLREAPRLRRGKPRARLSVLLALGGLTLVWAPAEAQYEREISQRQADYDAAQRERDFRASLVDAQHQRLTNALALIDPARDAGGDRHERAIQQAVTEGLEVRRLRVRLEESERLLEQRREALQEVLDLHGRALAARWANTSDRQELERLRLLLTGLEAQHQELQVQQPARLIFWPDVEVTARDGPDMIRAKAMAVHRLADDAQREYERVSEQIGRLETRLANQRRAGDPLANLLRFGDTNLPVVPPSRPRDDGQLSTVDHGALPLDQQIEDLNAYRAELELMRDEARARARRIEQHLPGGSAGGAGL